MIKNTILVVGAAYVGTMLPQVATVLALLAALAVAVLALAFERMNEDYGS